MQHFTNQHSKAVILKSETTTEDMKNTLLNAGSNIGGVVFQHPYRTALGAYKEIWKWMVMEILPLISYDWKVRVIKGPRAKDSGGSILKIVTISDFAFAFTVLQWGAKKKWAKSDTDPTGLYDDSNMSSLSDSETTDASDEKRKAGGKPGRKKGEVGFATEDNIAIFNKQAEKLDDILYVTGNAENISAWEKAAMKLVNKERNEGEPESHAVEEKKIERIVPFVMPARRTTDTMIVRV